MAIFQEFYEVQLFVLAAFCVAAFLLEKFVASKNSRLSLKEQTLPNTNGNGNGHGHANGGWKLKSNGYSLLLKNYLLVYTVVMAADWLQGPYVYSLYHEQYNYPERTVAVLFVTGFTSAGFFSPLVGDWADQNGRKKTCLIFCMAYAAACFLMLIDFLPILMIGRVLGGFSTSILFSCFESWLISASSTHNVSQLELSSIMGKATTMNGLAATTAGVISNWMVKRTDNYLAPFMASAVVLGIAYFLISTMWEENFGASSQSAPSEKGKDSQKARLLNAWSIVRQDTALLTLLLTQTLFEGSMYLFVFLWVPSLQEVSASNPGESLPLGFIFSSFMISMMLGSFVYTFIVTYPPPSSAKGDDDSLTLHTKLASLVCATACLTFALASSSAKAPVRFWAFCLFEACVGVYYPVMGVLRGKLVPDGIRATLYSLFRLPLNTFVTITLLTGTGHSDSRRTVFIGCAIALMVASLSLMRMVATVQLRDRTPVVGPRDA